MNGMDLELDMYEHRGLNEVFFWKGGRGSVGGMVILFEEGEGEGEGGDEVFDEERRVDRWSCRVLFCFVLSSRGSRSRRGKRGLPYQVFTLKIGSYLALSA